MTTEADALPDWIGPYRIEERLGVGGMGVVYRGHSEAGEEVAVKQIRGYRFGEDDRARFAAEMEALKAVYGSRVAPYIDSDAEAEQPWLAMKHIPGATLRQWVGEHGPLEPVLVAILGATLAEGLTSIHAAGLLHRDLKPHNIILGYDGPMVIDFGLAVLVAARVARAEARSRITSPGTVVGTLVCMPPEQVRGEQLTPAADLYALGATLLYAATGHYPFAGETEYQLMEKINSPSVTADLTGLPSVLHESITAVLAKDATNRPGLPTVTSMLTGVVKQAGLTAVRARRMLREVTAANTAPAAEPDQPRSSMPSTARRRRAADAASGHTTTPPGALRAGRRLRADYARTAAL